MASNDKHVQNKRILLVDDDNELRGAIREMLEIDGHLVTEAGNGADALELFGRDDFDLVVTDFEMPVMKGSELALRLKALAPQMPVLMISSYEREICPAENPVDSILDKPFTFADLRTAVSKLLLNC